MSSTSSTTGVSSREIVEELEVRPRIVRYLWHEWMIDLEDGDHPTAEGRMILVRT